MHRIRQRQQFPCWSKHTDFTAMNQVSQNDPNWSMTFAAEILDFKAHQGDKGGEREK